MRKFFGATSSADADRGKQIGITDDHLAPRWRREIGIDRRMELGGVERERSPGFRLADLRSNLRDLQAELQIIQGQLRIRPIEDLERAIKLTEQLMIVMWLHGSTGCDDGGGARPVRRQQKLKWTWRKGQLQNLRRGLPTAMRQ